MFWSRYIVRKYKSACILGFVIFQCYLFMPQVVQNMRNGRSKPGANIHESNSQDKAAVTLNNRLKSDDKIQSQPNTTMLQPPLFQKETQNIYYLKIHKTGSTTFHNILCRYGMTHGLKIALFNRLSGMPYPEICRPELLFEIIDQDTFEPYNIVCDHAFYDEIYPFSYMPITTVSIASIREPFSRLKSAFKYFELAKKLDLTSHEYPMYEFLKQVNTLSNAWTIPFWAQNTQIRTFGVNQSTINSQTELKKAIGLIDQRFDFVFLMERFSESMVHLKRTFNWRIQDILHFINNGYVHKEQVPTNAKDTEMMVETNKKMSAGDYMLYDYFKRKSERLFATYNPDFHDEVAHFKSINANVSSICNNVYNLFKRDFKTQLANRATLIKRLKEPIMHFPSSPWHDAFSLNLIDCRLMQLDTLHYHNALRVRQFPATCNEELGPPFVREPMYDNHKIGPEWCRNDTSDIYNFALDTFLGL